MTLHKTDDSPSVTSGHATPAEPVKLLLQTEAPDNDPMTSMDKVKLLMARCIGRTDLYAVRWEYPSKSGYSPVCLNNRVPGVCRKPDIKCSVCPNSDFMPVRNKFIADHLQGKSAIGTYALLKNETCNFLAIDFDEKSWKEDALAFVMAARSAGIQAYLEISRSGNGAHVWIFFETAVPAVQARALGTALTSLTCRNIRQLKLSSYDRMFPNQDYMPKGGMGNLIHVPLQGTCRTLGRSVFVDDDFVPHDNQWAFLSSVSTVSMFDLNRLLAELSHQFDPLDVAFLNQETRQSLLKTPRLSTKIQGPMPAMLHISLGSTIRFKLSELNNGLQNCLIRMACFQNQRFYINQRQKRSVYGIPRIITASKVSDDYLDLPRGCMEGVSVLLETQGIAPIFDDNRSPGVGLNVKFTGDLRPDQQAALDAIEGHEDGVLCAPPAFGKTVVCAALIAKRDVSTLVIVDTTLLVDQWSSSLSKFLDAPRDSIGTLVEGKNKLTGIIDIACDASLQGRKNLESLLEKYGQIIIDECHGSATDTYKKILPYAKPKFIIGVTAEDKRSDGHQPLVFMRCGPIRHIAAKAIDGPKDLQAITRHRSRIIPLAPDILRTEVDKWLIEDEERNADIVKDVLENYAAGRTCLVLSARVDHVKNLAGRLRSKTNLYVLSSDGKGKESKRAVIEALRNIPEGVPHILISTFSLLGKAFDHPPLNTLFLVTPFGWQGSLRQYTGRLERPYPLKENVKVFDYVDDGHPQTIKLWTRRKPSYKKLGYRLVGEDATSDLFDDLP